MQHQAKLHNRHTQEHELSRVRLRECNQCRLRTEIDRLLGSDRVLSLVVAIETALSDERYEVCYHLYQRY